MHNLSTCAQPIRISPGRGYGRERRAWRGNVHHVPSVWRAPAGPRSAPQNRMQFDEAKIQQSLKTLQFQHCELLVRYSRRGIACEIGCRRGGPDQATYNAPPVRKEPAGPRGMAEPRADAQSEARGVDGERAGPTAPATPGAQPTEHRRRSQRNTGGAAATRVCERPGGESPPPGLYTGFTCR